MACQYDFIDPKQLNPKILPMKAQIIILPVLLAMCSCSKDLVLFEKQYPRADKELWSLYERFEAEAEKRGQYYDLQSLRIGGEISEIAEQGVAGTCQFGSAINNHVTIDESFWNRSSNLLREFVVFHELGHCVLLRPHDESRNARGLCLSMMRSGTGNCIDAYSVENRQAYIDELFSSGN